MEVTDGPAGWHVHLHVLIVLDTPLSADNMDNLGRRMFNRWAIRLDRAGFSAIGDKGGLDVRPVRMTGDDLDDVAEYPTKAAREVASPGTKMARREGNRTQFQILLATGLADDLERWIEWEQGSLGRYQMTWSRGLREWAGLHRERSDEQIASDDRGGTTYLMLPGDTWRAVRHEVADLLDAAELGGADAARRWIESRGLRWFTPNLPARE